jgi:tRNA (guanine-N7-)-methyltransferase
MKHLPNHFGKGQLQKIFFTFPDPHFKKSNHRRRIVSPTLLAEYAYVLAEGGMAYTITDVQELHEWMVAHFSAHPLFVRVSDPARLAADPCVDLITNATEESKKVAAHGGNKYLAVFERVKNPPPLQ